MGRLPPFVYLVSFVFKFSHRAGRGNGRGTIIDIVCTNAAILNLESVIARRRSFVETIPCFSEEIACGYRRLENSRKPAAREQPGRERRFRNDRFFQQEGRPDTVGTLLRDSQEDVTARRSLAKQSPCPRRGLLHPAENAGFAMTLDWKARL